MHFAMLQHPDFLAILCRHYRYVRFDETGERTGQQVVPLFRSALPLRGAAVRSLPLGYYLTADTLNSKLGEAGWQSLQQFSRQAQQNICVHSVGSCTFSEGLHVADNPMYDCATHPEPVKAYTRSHRQNMNTEHNKARREGISFHTCTDEANLRAFYRVLATQYVKQHRMLFQPIGLYRDLLQANLATLLLAKKDDDVLGGMVLMRDGETLHYMWGAMARYSNLSIGALLVDHALQRACAEGVRYFNFGSTPLSDKALLAFKMKWGAQHFPVMQYATLQHQPMLDLNNAFPAARKLYSLAPVWALRPLMPLVVPWVMS